MPPRFLTLTRLLLITIPSSDPLYVHSSCHRCDISSLTDMVRRVAFPLWHWRSARQRAMALLLGLRRPHPIHSSLVPRQQISDPFILFPLSNTRVSRR